MGEDAGTSSSVQPPPSADPSGSGFVEKVPVEKD